MATALIIDDNNMNLTSLSILLSKEGIDPIALSTPTLIEQALEEVDDIVVMFLDLEFPRYNGLDLIASLKAMPALANVPIIAYSVHISEVNETRMAGFDGFIGKPLDVHQFPDQLRRILQGEAVWDVGQ
ncbi:MAG: response regulator [Anaerolineae bacterium]